MSRYSQGVCNDGAAILRDGQRLTVDEIIAHLNAFDTATDILSENSYSHHMPHMIAVPKDKWSEAIDLIMDTIGDS